ncbi:MAG: hypothetical protein H0W24_01425, partial [Lysobacter sp.]|nr:hypothetical protein [Lysobacter sp.]
VQTGQSGGRLFARSVEVVHNVRDGQPGGGQYGGQYGDQYGGQYGGGQQYGNELRGTVGFVDARSRTIDLERGGYGGDRIRVRYDDRTLVEYQGRRYNPRDLDPGDQVIIHTRRIGNNEPVAERIIVERSARTR